MPAPRPNADVNKSEHNSPLRVESRPLTPSPRRLRLRGFLQGVQNFFHAHGVRQFGTLSLVKTPWNPPERRTFSIKSEEYSEAMGYSSRPLPGMAISASVDKASLQRQGST